MQSSLQKFSLILLINETGKYGNGRETHRLPGTLPKYWKSTQVLRQSYTAVLPFTPLNSPCGDLPHLYGLVPRRRENGISGWHERYGGHIVVMSMQRFDAFVRHKVPNLHRHVRTARNWNQTSVSHHLQQTVYCTNHNGSTISFWSIGKIVVTAAARWFLCFCTTLSISRKNR